MILILAVAMMTCRNWPPGDPAAKTAPAAPTPIPEASATTDPAPRQPAPEVYGIALTGLEAVRDTVRPGQSLSTILQAHGVGYGTIMDAAESSKALFDVRNLRPGQPFCILHDNGPGSETRYFIYEKNDIDYLVFDLGEPVTVSCASKPVEIKERTVSGTIDGSLWDALQRLQVDPALAVTMSEIFAWTIDFHHLQAGDSFTAVLEERFIDGQSVGLGDIAGIRFHHRGRDHYAIRFESDGKTDHYFDEKGQSLRKAFLKAPLRYKRISSGYSRRRLHPVTGKYRPHPGIDYAAPTGTPVMSVGDGVVARAGYNASNGNYITVRHNNVYSTQYLHLSRFVRGLAPGKAVSQGQCIGYVGSTGSATGPHLDFRLYVNGHTVNPLTYDMPSANPVEENLLAEYRQHMAVIKARLDALYTELQTSGEKKT